MYPLYKTIINILYLFLYPVCKIKANRGEQKCRGRLGLLDDIEPSDIWLHAASMGEVKVIGHLIDMLQKKSPHLKLHLTTMTETGFNAAQELYKNITVTYFPYDTKTIIRRTLGAIQPKVIVIAETEIWPTLIREASAQNISLVMVNGRMSAKAFGRYNLVQKTMTKILSHYDRFYLKSELDYNRYQNFGVNVSRTEIVGDMKFDAPVSLPPSDLIKKFRSELGFVPDDFVFVAGSTRPGEEIKLLDCYKKLKTEHKHLKLILVPRHLERIDEIVQIIKDNNLSYNLYGDQNKGSDILLVNRMGMLIKLYEIADCSFVGGTLTDIGGHNLLEPVWSGCPVLYGPSLANVIEAAEYIEKHNFGQKVNDAGQLLFLMQKVISGKVIFNRKKNNNIENSATGRVADYLISKISI